MKKGGLTDNNRRALKAGGASLLFRTLVRISGLALLLGILLYMTPEGLAGQGTSWQIGRGAIQKAQGAQPAILKLSLRNEGAPSKANVRIMGRWSQGAPGKRGFSMGEMGSFVELGSFDREVELKSTAILEMSLAPLGAPQAGRQTLEIAVVTDSELTDGQAIQY